MKRVAAALDTEGSIRFLWWLIGASVIIGFFMWLAVGANGPDDPKLTERQKFGDFGTVAFTVEHGAVSDDFCALLAATDAQRQTGMMGRNDFGGYDGMVFAFPKPLEPSQVYFYNRRVPIALTVAWFDSQGRWVGSKDLEPCPDMDGCPSIAPPAPFRYAVEVKRGGLDRLGLGPGSQISFSEGC